MSSRGNHLLPYQFQAVQEQRGGVGWRGRSTTATFLAPSIFRPCPLLLFAENSHFLPVFDPPLPPTSTPTTRSYFVFVTVSIPLELQEFRVGSLCWLRERETGGTHSLTFSKLFSRFNSAPSNSQHSAHLPSIIVAFLSNPQCSSRFPAQHYLTSSSCTLRRSNKPTITTNHHHCYTGNDLLKNK